MQVIVTGWRSSIDDWLQAQQWPLHDLPSLSEEQRVVAGKLGISEEDYARSAYASELSRPALAVKAERLGELVQAIMRERFPDASVRTVDLRTFDGKFAVTALAGGRELRFKIDEGLVDSVFESGSNELESNLRRIVELSLPSSGAVRAS